MYYARRDRNIVSALTARSGEPSREAATDIRLVLEGLPHMQQKLYRLYYEEARSIREIAGMLGGPEGTIKYLLYQFRRRLRVFARLLVLLLTHFSPQAKILSTRFPAYGVHRVSST